MQLTPQPQSLKNLQNWLANVITHPRGTEKALSEEAANAKLQSASELHTIVDTAPLSRIERLDIYAEGYFARLLEALGNDFENLVRVLTSLFDENAFRKIVSAYLELHPSMSRTVGDVGQHLPAFLRSYAAVNSFPFLAEVAEMDWRATRALYIDADPPFDPSSLANLGEDEWESLQFRLDSSVQWFRVGHTVTRVWNETEIDSSLIVAQSGIVLIHRFQEFVYVHSISETQAIVLKAMRESQTLGEICGALQESEAESVMNWFGGWIANGVIKAAFVSDAMLVSEALKIDF